MNIILPIVAIVELAIDQALPQALLPPVDSQVEEAELVAMILACP